MTYWHGKNLQDFELNEVQRNTRKNDNIKNYIAAVNKIELFRFWESDIKNTNFDKILLKTIWER